MFQALAPGLTLVAMPLTLPLDFAQDGHGASIGSVPDCNGCVGFVTNITYRNCSFFGNAPMKIKTWANTTGEISKQCLPLRFYCQRHCLSLLIAAFLCGSSGNILFEDCLLNNADSAVVRY